MKQAKRGQAGFSLIEMVIVVAVLSILTGAIFSQIEKAQSRYKVEDQQLDLTQQERDFVDQFTRDLHQSGFPTTSTYGNRLDINSAQVSAGIWYVSQTDVWMEGNLDDNENVQEIRYHYDDGTSWSGPGPNPCPCIKRSSVAKVDGYFPWDSHQTTPQYFTEVQNLIPPTTNQPLFQIYNNAGNVPSFGSTVLLGSGTTIDHTAKQNLENVKAIRITLTTQALTPDADTHKTIQVTMNGTARLFNTY